MDLLQVTARTTVAWMIYGLLEGTALALFVWLLLRLLPRQNAGTRFVFWFSALLAMFLLPLLGVHGRPERMASGASGISSTFSLITLPVSWAFVLFAAWVVIATVNLIRVIIGLWQIRKIRRSSEEVDPENLSSEIAALLSDLRRPVLLCLSDRVQVPTAIGFLKPAIVVPRWFLNTNEISQQELKQVLVHELSHLRRGDDWTNLAQKFIKALLFFHPSAWWVEQQLSLEREMACDDEVVRRVASPIDYAQCLQRVAEKSFLRKQIALAQAIVSRMRQVTLRVAQILDSNRPGTTRIWKPALPMMVLAASLCGLSAWTAPALVSFSGDSAGPAATAAVVSGDANVTQPNRAMVKQVKASFVTTPVNVSTESSLQKKVKEGVPRHLNQQARLARPKIQRVVSSSPKMALAKSAGPVQRPEVQTYVAVDYVVQTAQFSVSMPGNQGTLQVQMWQVSVLHPADRSSKTIPRKKI